VYGPAQPKYARLELLERASLEVDFSVMGDPSRDERVDKDTKSLIQRVLENAVRLEAFPRMLIEVRVRVLRDDGCCIATALNACTLALLDAALPMNFTPVRMQSLPLYAV
jgi:ribonuclease PH